MKIHRFTEPTLRWLEVILAERFGHAWQLQTTDEGLTLKLKDTEGAVKFDQVEDRFSQPRSDMPFTSWDADSEGWQSVLGGPLPAPGATSLPNPLIEARGADHVIHYDVLGLTYWMLARVEEIGRTDLDEHGRFPATASHCYLHGYLDRPIVDEWMHVLGQVILRQWPGIVLKSHAYSVQFSHDVDRPFLYAYMRWPSLIKAMLGDVIKRHSAALAFGRLLTWSRVAAGNLDVDPYNTFSWLMDVSEANGAKSCFYFICGQSNEKFDPNYDINDPLLLSLLKTISSRGHKIGLHPSYNCFNSAGQIAVELGRLRHACARLGIEDMRFGSRMHYLRWEQPRTMLALNSAGLSHDSTLIYPDRIGFRCGTCHTFPAFDALNDQQIDLRITPLIIMDQLLLSDGLGGGNEVLLKRVADISQKVKMVNGVFTILWHNSSLESRRTLYAAIAKNVTASLNHEARLQMGASE